MRAPGCVRLGGSRTPDKERAVRGARPGPRLPHCPDAAEVAAPVLCLPLSDPAVQQARECVPSTAATWRAGRQLAQALAAAGHSRVAWPPSQGYAANHSAAPEVPATLCSCVEQNGSQWLGSLESPTSQEFGEPSRWCSDLLTSYKLYGESVLLML